MVPKTKTNVAILMTGMRFIVGSLRDIRLFMSARKLPNRGSGDAYETKAARQDALGSSTPQIDRFSNAVARRTGGGTVFHLGGASRGSGRFGTGVTLADADLTPVWIWGLPGPNTR